MDKTCVTSVTPKVCQVDYVHLEANPYVFVTLNIAKVGFQMNIINLTDFMKDDQSHRRLEATLKARILTYD